jgi:hypothetical protein
MHVHAKHTTCNSPHQTYITACIRTCKTSREIYTNKCKHTYVRTYIQTSGVAHEGSLWVFGGSAGSSRKNDLQRFDLGTRTWHTIDSQVRLCVVCVCVYVCVCVRVLCMWICVHVCVCADVYAYAYMCVYVEVYACVCVCNDMYIRMLLGSMVHVGV